MKREARFYIDDEKHGHNTRKKIYIYRLRDKTLKLLKLLKRLVYP